METFSSIIIDDSNYQRYNKSSSIPDDIAMENMDYMSFVGIVFYENSILGFADSKSTKDGEHGKEEDLEHFPVQKLFKNDHFLLALTGTNSMTPKNEVKRIWLEDWINDRLNNWKTPERCCCDMYHYFQNTEFNKQPVVKVEAGYVNEEYGLMAFRAEIGVDIYRETKFKPQKKDAIFNGDSSYTEFFDHNRYLLYTDQEDALRNALEQREKRMEIAVGYIPVGGPWDIKKMNF